VIEEALSKDNTLIIETNGKREFIPPAKLRELGEHIIKQEKESEKRIFEMRQQRMQRVGPAPGFGPAGKQDLDITKLTNPKAHPNLLMADVSEPTSPSGSLTLGKIKRFI
jgi:hypothetical protein